jgi:hypothetical protein
LTPGPRDLADIPGGNTGLLVRGYERKNADEPVCKADTALMAEMRATERQAAEELGQWVTTTEPAGVNVNVIERLNAGRRRAREDRERRQALAAGTQMAA